MPRALAATLRPLRRWWSQRTSPRRASVLRALFEAVAEHRARTIGAMALLVAAKLSAVGVPAVLKAIVDTFSRPERLAEPVAAPAGVPTALVLPVFLLLGYALLRFVGTLLTELRDLLFARVSRLTVTAFAERTFAHLLTLGARFHHQRQTGALTRELERGTAGIGFLLGAGLFTLLPTLVEFGAIVGVMAWNYSASYTLVLITTFVAYATLTTMLVQRRELQQRRVNALDSRANAHLVDALLNHEAVRLFTAEQHERRRYAADMAEWVEGSVRNQRALSALHLGQGGVIALGVAAVMLLAGADTVRGVMSVGDLVLVNAWLIQVCLPLNALGFVFRESRDALVDTERLFDLLEQRDEVAPSPTDQPLALRAGAVAFEHVDFAYEGGRPVLQDVSVTIEPGRTLAVVGGSGSGKSTLARLLLRLYDPQLGRVTIDGQDLRHVDPASIRRAIGVVPQDTALFDETIAYNIEYGRFGAGMAAVTDAARAAQLHELIASLPEGYDTRVGERGARLSGGERQRVAIARAFLKNPPILILDEATSALDTRAERAIQGELDRVAQGRTTLIIAHRLSTIVEADRIIVMDRGRIVESGRHEELLAHDGLYAQLWRLQQEQREFDRLERRVARRVVDAGVLLRGVLDALAPSAERRDVSLYVSLGDAPAWIEGDPMALGEALWQLASHALAATPAGQRLEVALDRAAERVRVSFTDSRHVAPAPVNGGATPPFDPLALRSVIERQGGSFAMQAPSSTQGLRFTVELRPHGAPQELAARHPPTPAPLRLDGVAVAWRQADSPTRRELQHAVQAQGASVQTLDDAHAPGWLDALAAGAQPGVLVCDLTASASDAAAFVRELRRREAQRDAPLAARVPAIALTARDASADRLQTLLGGFQAALPAPVDPAELVRAIAVLAGRA